MEKNRKFDVFLKNLHRNWLLPGAVGATKSVAEIPVEAGIFTGCGEGLKRNRPATRITRRMIPRIMSQGRRDRLDIY